jgi:hypothetical protein
MNDFYGFRRTFPDTGIANPTFFFDGVNKMFFIGCTDHIADL